MTSKKDDSEVTERTIRQWSAEREELKKKLILKTTSKWSDPSEPKLIGGVDISFIVGDNVNACAALVVCEAPSLNVVFERLEMIQLTAPYIPGFLAFREAQPLANLIEELRTNNPELIPDIILVDGNGILHSDRFGLASHLGVLVDIPTIGVAKNLYQMNELGIQRDEDHAKSIAALEHSGDSFPIKVANGEELGLALKTCSSSTKPVFVSIGHKIDLLTAKNQVLRCSKFRVPEPIRQADIRSREFLRSKFQQSNTT